MTRQQHVCDTLLAFSCSTRLHIKFYMYVQKPSTTLSQRSPYIPKARHKLTSSLLMCSRHSRAVGVKLKISRQDIRSSVDQNSLIGLQSLCVLLAIFLRVRLPPCVNYKRCAANVMLDDTGTHGISCLGILRHFVRDISVRCHVRIRFSKEISTCDNI